MFTADITVMPLKELLDPQGKAVMSGLNNLGIDTVNDVRIGKHIQLQINASSKEEADAIANDAAKKLLANPVMEQFRVNIN